MTTSKSSYIKKIFGFLLLFVAGLVAGAALFMPWKSVWFSGVAYLSDMAPGTTITCTDITRASMTSARLEGLVVAGRNGQLKLDRVKVQLGVAPLVRFTVGQASDPLKIDVNQDKTITFAGSLPIKGLVPGTNTSGELQALGDLTLAAWEGPVQSGNISCTASALGYGGTRVEGMALSATLKGTSLKVESFKAVKPMPVDSSGVVTLNFNNFKQSTYHFTGAVTMAGKKTKFDQQGKLAQLF